MIDKLLNKSRMKKYYKDIDKINTIEKEIEKFSQKDFLNKTLEFQNHIDSIKNNNYEVEKYLGKILPYTFAMVKEASHRILNMKHFDVQLIGGEILHEGDIAEMKTGEGKTLVITLPCYLNALTRNGVHIITVNDYLAKRDMEQMKPLYEYLGLTVGIIQHDMKIEERKNNYDKDITYVTNSELGFDYLRDNLSKNLSDKVLVRGLNYCIIDEIDSILIDEARTPLIISGLGDKPNELYYKANDFSKIAKIEYFKQSDTSLITKTLINESEEYNCDVVVNRKENSLFLTKQGSLAAEKFFNIENLGDNQNGIILHHIIQALKARYLFKKNTNYLIKNGKIEIIDEYTGRVLEGRQYSEGLHQALETKENLNITPENKTLASITYQNLFKLYKKKCGLTGTAKTEEDEFYELHNMMVVQVPTNKPIKRIDQKDKVFKTKKEKYLALTKDIIEEHKKGRPILIGTPNVYVSEVVNEILNRLKIPHNILNAKNNELEANIISKAGEFGSITVSTNMAGRGTDIKISEESRKVGGLKVIGIERNESRRIDNQLIGRSGRQGDVGESVFYLSLEDDLLKLFANNSSLDSLFSINTNYGDCIESKILSKLISNAQKQIEGLHYEQRKNVIKYDEIISKIRSIVYDNRDEFIYGNLYENYKKIIINFITNLKDGYNSNEQSSLEDYIKNQIKLYIPECEKDLKNLDSLDNIINYFDNILLDKIKSIDESNYENAFRYEILNIIDNNWMNFLEEVTELQKRIVNISYKGQDPIDEFIKQTNNEFNILIINIQVSIIKILFNNLNFVIFESKI